MSRNDNRDPSYDLERNQTLTILLSSKIKRNQLERDSPQKNQISRKASEDNNNKQKGKTKAVKKEEPPPSSKMVSAINAYASDSQQSKTRKKKGKT